MMAKQGKYKSIIVTPDDRLVMEKWRYHNTDAGWVYAVRFGSKVKIGKTKYPTSRINDIQRKQEASFDDIHFIACDNAVRAERILHGHFSKLRLDGEWFNLSQDQLLAIYTIQKYENKKFYCKI